MKKLIILPLILICLFSSAQSLQINWQNCYGGSQFEECYDIIENQNGYLIVGSSESNDGDVSINYGGTDCWLIKTSNAGELGWVKSYGGSEGDGIFRIFPADEDNFYLLCCTYSSDGDISYDPYPLSTDFWIIKVDNLGNIIWDKILGGNMLDQMWTGTSTNDGGVVALGWTGSTDGDITINYGAYDMWMVKLNNQGEKEWDFSLGASWFDYGMAIIQTIDGGYLVGGQSMLDEGGNLNCIPHSNKYEAVLVKLDSARNIEWQRCYGGTEDDGIWSINELSDGYIFAGFASSNDGDISGWHGGGDIWIVRIDFNGNIIWQKCLGGSNYEFTDNIIPENDGSFTIIGATQSIDGDVIGNHTLSQYYHDIWVVRLSSEGDLLWQQCIGGGGNEQVQFGTLKKDYNKYIIAGQTDWGPSYDVECTPYNGSYADEYWILEVTDTTTGIQLNATNNSGLNIYPIPGKDYIMFEFSDLLAPFNFQPTSILITNSFGQSVAQMPISGDKTAWDCRNISPGIYFYQFQTTEKTYTGKFLIIK